MNDFLQGKISEQTLLDKTPVGEKYEAIYLCSATTLPEFRGKGITKKLALEAINNIRATNPYPDTFCLALYQ